MGFLKNLLKKKDNQTSASIPTRSKKTDRLTYHETKTGNYYLPTDAINDGIRGAILRNEIFDEPVYKSARKYIKPNTIALDVGSNFGQMAILMSKHVGENGRVYAFEAEEFVYEILKKNIAANNAPIIPVFGAVHNKPNEILYFPELDFKEFQTYGSYGIDYANNQGRPVKTVSIDSIDFDLPISFMKVDVQGGDLLAMQGAVETIKKHQMPILFEYEHYHEESFALCFQDYIDFAQSIDYYFASVVMDQNFLLLPKTMRSKSV